MNRGEQKARESLNAYQANRLRVTCQYIDKLLVETEGVLNAADSKAAFPRYAADILPAQRRTVEDYNWCGFWKARESPEESLRSPRPERFTSISARSISPLRSSNRNTCVATAKYRKVLRPS